VTLAEARWLTGENVHPEVVAHLRSRGLDVLDAKEQGWHGRADEEILDEAYRSGRIVLTHDGDFGALALLGGRRVVGVEAREPVGGEAEVDGVVWEGVPEDEGERVVFTDRFLSGESRIVVADRTGS